MPSTSLLEQLKKDFPGFQYKSGEHFEWRPSEKTIMYDPGDPYLDAHLLHETAHATLKHARYDRDIDLIKMERDAWEAARTELGPRYGVSVPTSILHHDMDTYRDWLHARSICPNCGATGLQVQKKTYKCVTCLQQWNVNEARTCELRRYRI
jgi:hypothetical protein